METQTDPYPSINTVDHLQILQIDQLFLYIGIAILAIVLLAIISAAEKAILKITDKDIADLKKSDVESDQHLLNLLDQPIRLQAVFSISTTLLIVFIAIVFNSILHHYLQSYLSFNFEVIVYTFIIGLALVKLATLIPSIYSTKYYMLYVKWSLTFVRILHWLLKPFVSMYFFVFNLVNKIIPQQYRISENEFNKLNDSDLINEENEEEQLILKGIANFGNISVKQIMRNRMDVEAIELQTDYSKVDAKIKETRYSRLPIFENNLDTIKGILYVKDILINKDKPDFNWQNLIRPAYFVPEHKKIDDLLKEFRTKHTHIAIVVDEYGGTSGIVTLEDILEEIVGDISDEYDEADDELRYSKLDDWNYVFDGKTPLNDIYRLLDLSEDTFDEVREEADTIGGLVLSIAGRFVFNKEKVQFENFIFTVESADRRRVKRVKMTILENDEK